MDIEFIVDKLHIKGHKGDYCYSNCHPDLFPAVKNLNSVVCEQKNYWLGGYKHAMKHMTYYKYNFFLFIICDEYNKMNIANNINKLCSASFVPKAI